MKKTAKQLSFKNVNGWGGKRRGAGRPNESGLVSHAKRPRIKFSTPVHITLKIRDGLVNLRCGEVAAAFKKSAARASVFGFKVVHFSIQNDHVHMIVETPDNESLALGMRSFGCRFGKLVRKIVGGHGPVFSGRYHVSVLNNPTKMKNAMAYVLQNFSKHSKLLNHVDQYSSAAYFVQWNKLLGKKAGPLLVRKSRPPELPFYLSAPGSWLAREGWMRGVAAARKPA